MVSRGLARVAYHSILEIKFSVGSRSERCDALLEATQENRRDDKGHHRLVAEVIWHPYYCCRKAEKCNSYNFFVQLFCTVFFLYFFLGLKFRRQHWFFLGCLVVFLLTLLIIWASTSMSGSGSGSGASGGLVMSPEEQARVVSQLLQEVPLIDG